MNRTTTQYTIVHSEIEKDGYKLASTLPDLVNHMIMQGWEPYGQPYIYGKYMFQALVKYEQGN